MHSILDSNRCAAAASSRCPPPPYPCIQPSACSMRFLQAPAQLCWHVCLLHAGAGRQRRWRSNPTSSPSWWTRRRPSGCGALAPGPALQPPAAQSMERGSGLVLLVPLDCSDCCKYSNLPCWPDGKPAPLVWCPAGLAAQTRECLPMSCWAWARARCLCRCVLLAGVSCCAARRHAQKLALVACGLHARLNLRPRAYVLPCACTHFAYIWRVHRVTAVAGPVSFSLQRNVGNLATHKDMNVMSCEQSDRRSWGGLCPAQGCASAAGKQLQHSFHTCCAPPAWPLRTCKCSCCLAA